MQGDTKDPFPDIVTVDWSFLEDCSSRTKCIKCNKSRKYYCYTCCIALPHIKDKLPKVKLPLKVDIIKHPKELDGKSTAPHASILAPDDVTIHTYPCIPDYDPKKVIVVFPGEDSVTLDELKEIVETDPDTTTRNTGNQSTPTSKDGSVETGHPANRSCDASVKTDNGNDNVTFNNNKDLLTQSHNNNLLGAPEAAGQKCDSTPNTKPQSSTPSDVIGNSECDSQTDSKRKRTLSDEERNGENQSADNECGDSAPAVVKHRKICLRHCPFEKVVFVDCTWNQTKQIVTDERLKGLKKVELKSQLTHFWRTQEGMPKTYLSTIEAIYFFLRDFHTIFVDPVYRHDYDNLLMFFCFMYHKIKQSGTIESA